MFLIWINIFLLFFFFLILLYTSVSLFILMRNVIYELEVESRKENNASAIYALSDKNELLQLFVCHQDQGKYKSFSEL